MKKFLSILIILFWSTHVFGDHTSNHNIVVTCEVQADRHRIGPLQIYFNKDTVSLSWLTPIGKMVEFTESKGSSYFKALEAMKSYNTGEPSDNFTKFYNEHRPVKFTMFSQRNWINVSKSNTTLIATTKKYSHIKQEVNQKLSVIMYLNRINAVGKMILRMEHDPKIKYPAMEYVGLKKRHFELEIYLLERCRVNSKKF